MSYYKVEQLHEGIYSLWEPTEVCSFLVVGEKSAVLYDTGFGMDDLLGAVREITGLPLEVVLSHGHYDHVNGAFQFDGAWIHPADEVLALRHASRTGRRNAIGDGFARKVPDTLDREAYIHAGAGTLKALEIGRLFDPGGLTVEVIALEGHTSGSVGLLIHERRVLLAGDALGPHIWMFLADSLPLEAYLAMLARVQTLPFDHFYIGHSNEKRPRSDIALYESVARNIDVNRSTAYPRLPELGGMLYEEEHDGKVVGIVFKPD